MSIRNEAKLEVIEEITKEVQAKGGENGGMMSFAIGMQTMMSLSMYDAKLDEKMGDIISLLTALEKSGFTDANGTTITDTITFQNLKKRLTAGDE